MDKKKAKKWACREAYLILKSTIEAGWSPNIGKNFGFPKADCERILDSMDDLMGELYKRSGPLNTFEETQWESLTELGFPFRDRR